MEDTKDKFVNQTIYLGRRVDIRQSQLDGFGRTVVREAQNRLKSEEPML